ncbi:unnamed protein product [Ilex paraguariensis]|uniref:Leucine-rich repeat-containing N-terminal plant-type domain-containing protein n=1 Tax=Ilex paraguariensis TaxID=185542 RepID=A0ABC8U881_9AQUA
MDMLLPHYLLASSALPTTTATATANDEIALLALKDHITLDPHAALAKNWTNESSICNWIGVTCTSRSQLPRVTALNLSHKDLEGTLPTHLANLSSLILLDISNNSFHGQLPQELAHLQRLKTLNLQFNFFTGGVLPWLGGLPELQHLLLAGNNFTGTISEKREVFQIFICLLFFYLRKQASVR